MLGVKGGNAPGKGGSGNAEILQAALNLEEVVDHFLLSGLGPDKLGVVLDVLDQSVGILAHLEEVSLLGCLDQLSAALGALAIGYLRIGIEGFVGRAIPALVVSLIDIALLVESLEDLGHSGDVIVVGGADEVVVACTHAVKNGLDLACYVVHVLLRRDACFLGAVLDLLAVLVRAGAEENVVAALSLIAGNRVGHDDLVGVAEVRLLGCIRDRGRDIKLGFLLIHVSVLLLIYDLFFNSYVVF